MNRGEFMSRIHGFATEKDARNIELAYLLAKKIHKGQVRKELGPDGQPLRYFEHLRRVALILIDEAGVVDPDIIIAALLHDSIEDTEEVKLVAMMVQSLFGSEVTFLVRLVTKIPKAGYITRLTQGVEVTEGRVMLIKAADRLDNMRSLPVDNPSFCEKQKKETREVFLPLFAKAETVLAKDMVPGFKKIVTQVEALL